MTREELIKELKKLDEKTLEELLYRAQQKALANFDESRQRAFEQYLFNGKANKKSIYFDDKVQEKIVFSNGISLYYVNYNFLSINSPVIIRNSLLNEVKIEEIFNIEKQINNNIIKWIDTEWFSENAKYTMVEANGSLSGGQNLVTATFKTSEIVSADAILNKPRYQIDENYPILLAESEVGKAYILGYKK